MSLKADKLRDLSADELAQQIKDKKTELFNLRFQQATGQLSNPMTIRACRKEIARIHTILREQEKA